MIEDRIEDEYLDMTNEELEEADGFDYDENIAAEDEFREHIGDLHELFEIHAAMILVARMFDDNKITLGEYLELADYCDEYLRECGADVI